MITLTTAEDALKTLYLGVVAEQLNLKTDPLLTKIEQTSQDVWGKELVKLVPYGINGGIGCGSEAGALPMASSNAYTQFKTTLKNIFGTIEISDKAIRASENTAGAFINLLTNEMEGLIKASKYNLSRMLYGNGSGLLTTGNVDYQNFNSPYYLPIQESKYLHPGLVIEVYEENGESIGSARIKKVLEGESYVILDNPLKAVPGENVSIYVQGSKDNEITGLKGVAFNENIYGIERYSNDWLKPYVSECSQSSSMSLSLLQDIEDNIEERFNSNVDYIATTYALRRTYIKLLDTNRRNIDYMELDGGFKSVAFNGVPLVASKFIDRGSMYFINSDDFKMHQLCDWRWLESENGKILQQKPGLPVFTATLVKYAELICDRPGAMGVITGLTK